MTQGNVEWVSPVSTWGSMSLRNYGWQHRTYLWIIALKKGKETWGFFLPFSWSLAKACTLYLGLKPLSGELWVFTVGCSGIYCYGECLGVIERAQPASDTISKNNTLSFCLSDSGKHPEELCSVTVNIACSSLPRFLTFGSWIIHESPSRTAVELPPHPISGPCTRILRSFRKLWGVSCVFCSFTNCENIVHHSYLVESSPHMKGHELGALKEH